MKKILVLLALVPALALADRNEAGVFSFSSGVYPVTPGNKITATWANTLMDDVAKALTDSLCRKEGCGGMLTTFRFAPGDSAAPGISFTNFTTSGFYISGAADAPTLTLGLGSSPTLKVTKTALYHGNYQIPLFSEAVFFFPGVMINNQLLARIGVTTLTRIHAGLEGLVTYATTPAATGNPTASTGGVVFLKKRSGSSTSPIGHLVWTAGQTAANVVSTTSSTTSYFPNTVDLAPGDFIELWGPATADASFGDVSITLRLRRM